MKKRTYGYTKDWKIIPEEAAVVIRIFEMRADGYSEQDIAEQLNLEGVPFPDDATADDGRRVMNAVVYCRKSTDDERTATDGKSVARQEELARAFAERKGWPVAEVFTDDGISGAEFARRPDFTRLLAAAKRKPRQFDAVIMMALNRLGRDQVRVMMALTELHDAGVRVYCYQTGQEVKMSTPTEILIGRRA